MSESEIKDSIEREGFDPLVISNNPGFVYELHSHDEMKILAILDGSMMVNVEGKNFNCHKGDKIIISGGKKHSAVVGKKGCKFFWAERI